MTLGGFVALLADLGLGRVATRRSARNPALVAKTLARIQPIRFACTLASGLALLGAALCISDAAETRLLVALQVGVGLVQSLGCDVYLTGIGDVAWVGAARVVQLLAYGILVFALVHTQDDAPVVVAITLADLGDGDARGAVAPRASRRAPALVPSAGQHPAHSRGVDRVCPRVRHVLDLRPVRRDPPADLQGGGRRRPLWRRRPRDRERPRRPERRHGDALSARGHGGADLPRRAGAFAHRALRIGGAFVVAAAAGAASIGGPCSPGSRGLDSSGTTC